ncbi:hypothetical protein F5Y09DRAFT_184541 [Xylaria sp. FL1042]|nr:hypothetical protein F5Y09DRAFT_184541 [Xylaria sp. FL1042]
MESCKNPNIQSVNRQNNVLEAGMHLQRESRLLSAPLEIRRAIYAIILPHQVHMFLSQGKLRLSVCLQPHLGDDLHDGRERNSRRTSDRPPKSPPSWASRLGSSWGPHWQCEEISHEHRRSILYDFTFLCKRVFFDVSDMITEVAAVNVTDLETLGILLSRYSQPNNALNCGWNFWAYTCPDNIRKLNLAFRLPVAFYKELEDETTIPATGQQMSSKSTVNTSWVSLWPAIFRLQQLRSLHIWLDHDERSSWSVVKERMALRHVSDALTAHKKMRAQERGLRHLDVIVNLPKLHPGMAKPDSHFTQDNSPPPFTIHRRVRQRWHCIEKESGELGVDYSPDFPIMEMSREFENAFQFSLEFIEEYERRLWESGIDVEAMWEQEITELSEPAACWGTMDGTY